jgi:molecular chaperone DnaJ
MGKVNEINVKIPAGVEEGQYIRLRGQGNIGPRGGTKGDILVLIHEKQDDQFERDGRDLFLKFPISFSQAALGDEIIVPTINSSVKMKVPAGTQTGRIFRLKGQGLPTVHSSYGNGDLLVELIVVTPNKLSREETELLHKLKEFDSKRELKPGKSFISKLKEYFT